MDRLGHVSSSKFNYFFITARSQQKRTMLVSIPKYFLVIGQIWLFFSFIFESIRATGSSEIVFYRLFFFFKCQFYRHSMSFFEKTIPKPKPIYFILLCFWWSLVYTLKFTMTYIESTLRPLSRSRQGTQSRLNVSHGELSVWTKDHQKHHRMKCSNRFMSMAYRLSQSKPIYTFEIVAVV